jgi:hypothetical protein
VRKGENVSEERIPPEEIKRIKREKRRMRLEKIRRFVRELLGRG